MGISGNKISIYSKIAGQLFIAFSNDNQNLW